MKAKKWQAKKGKADFSASHFSAFILLLPALLAFSCVQIFAAENDAQFKRFDKDGDGKITAAEAENAAWFKTADKDADGVVTPDEARAWLAARGGAGKANKKTAPAATPAPGATAKPAAVEIEKTLGVRYADAPPGVDANLLSLDLYAPKDAKNLPVMVYVHGGSWARGDKREVGAKAAFFVAEGCVFVSVNYRLVPEGLYPANVQDIAAALAWLHEHLTEHGGEAAQIYLMGHSAGAHLASLVVADERHLQAHGRTPAMVKGLIELDTAALDVPALLAGGSALYRRAFGEEPARWREASPLHHVAAGKGLPPFLLVVAEGNAYKLKQAKVFAEAVRKAGSRAEIVEAPDKTHESLNASIGRPGDAVTAAILAFIRPQSRAQPVATHATDASGAADAAATMQKLAASADGTPASLRSDFEWQRVFQAPQTDANGQRMTGTEIIDFATHDARLFAGNSYWAETTEARRGQVFALDSAQGKWRRDLQMPPRYSRVAALRSVTFKTNAEGKPLAEPQSILIAGATYDKGQSRPGPAGVFMRDDATGQWVRRDLGSSSHAFAYTQIRSIGAHRDTVTGADLVFLGANPAPLGAYRGVHDATAPGRIRWDEQPEFTPKGFQRIMGFADCGGHLHAATQRAIFRRHDGPQPRWTLVRDFGTAEFMAAHRGALHEYWVKDDDIRGFTAGLDKDGREVFHFGFLNHWWSFDPASGALTDEADLRQLASEALGRAVHYVQTQCHTAIPALGSGVSYIGCELMYDPSYLLKTPGIPHMKAFAKEGFYIVRRQTAEGPTFTLSQITGPALDINKQPLARTRAFAVSPFAEDAGKVLLAGGFAPWFIEVSNTAWICRGTLEAQAR
jgi:acetyl esterase/lipase